MRISDWSSDVCSSDLPVDAPEALFEPRIFAGRRFPVGGEGELVEMDRQPHRVETPCRHRRDVGLGRVIVEPRAVEVRRPLLSNQFDEPGADAMLLSDLAELQHIAFLQHPSAEPHRSEEHTSELQSLMRISYAVFCLQKKKYTT